jgi:pyruvate-formate lyase-activating enzyme
MTTSAPSGPSRPALLTQTDHDRSAEGLRYVYPVVSRRAGGVSVGINLNPNNACNWACVYCQVPDLARGNGPVIDLALLERELDGFLERILHGDFMVTRVPEGARRLNDVAFSGNGEPTTSRDFPAAIECAGRVLARHGLLGRLKVVLITNGTGTGRATVRRALARLAELGGEVWFKLDRATRAGMTAVNGASDSPAAVARRLEAAARLCPTWLQTCLFSVDGEPPDEAECDAWLAFVRARIDAGTPLRGVLLYGLARPSMQPGSARLSSLPQSWMASFAERVRALGLTVRVTP